MSEPKQGGWCKEHGAYFGWLCQQDSMKLRLINGFQFRFDNKDGYYDTAITVGKEYLDDALTAYGNLRRIEAFEEAIKAIEKIECDLDCGVTKEIIEKIKTLSLLQSPTQEEVKE